MGSTCYMSSTRNSLSPGRRLPDFHSSQPPIWESDLILETVIITRKLTFTWYLERASVLYRVDGQRRD